jgi:hypothetical protein
MTKTLAKVAKIVPSTLSAFYVAAQMAAIYAADNTTVAIQPGRGFALDIGNVINFVLRVVMVIAVLLVFFYLVLGGIEWITSGGEKGKTEAARNKITAAVIGLIILAASYAILTLLLRFLGFDSLQGAINNVNPINQAQPQ